MLTRIITAIVLAVICIGLVAWLPPSLFAELTMLVMLLSLFEWDNLTARSNTRFVKWALLVLVAGVAIYLLSTQIVANPLPDLLPLVALAGAVFWVYQAATLRAGIEFKRSITTELGFGALAVLFCWAGLTWLRIGEPDGVRVVLLAITVICAVDIFALFIGMNFGRHKLAPAISPGKTIEGAVGGMLGALLVAALGGWFLLGLSGWQMMAWMIAAFCAALISMAGDLYISRLKRQAGVKDSGRVLPGHGGVLDRLDAILAGMPVFAALWWLLQ